jgi:hypothetical protein
VPLEITQCVVAEEPQLVLQKGTKAVYDITFMQVKPTPQSIVARPEAAQAQKPKTPDEIEIDRLSDKLASLRQANQAAGR